MIYGEMSFICLRYHYFYFSSPYIHSVQTHNKRDRQMSADSYNALHFICDFRFGDSSFYFSNDNFTHSTKHIHCVRRSLCLLIQYIQSTRSKFSELRVMYDNCVRKMKMTKKINFVYLLFIYAGRQRKTEKQLSRKNVSFLMVPTQMEWKQVNFCPLYISIPIPNVELPRAQC